MKNIGSYLWNIFEKILKYIIFKFLHLKVADKTWHKFMQLVKFGLVGLSNVVVSYVIYIVFLQIFQFTRIFINIDYLIAQFIGYVLSIFWSFYWNRKCVFETNTEEVPWQLALLKSFISYSITGVFLNSVLAYVWVEVIGIPKIISPFINLIINLPINFILNKFWAFKDTV